MTAARTSSPSCSTGARVSLIVGFAAAFISLLIGGADRARGRLFAAAGSAACLMRFTDFFLVIPDLALQIVIVAVLGSSRSSTSSS